MNVCSFTTLAVRAKVIFEEATAKEFQLRSIQRVMSTAVRDHASKDPPLPRNYT